MYVTLYRIEAESTVFEPVHGYDVGDGFSQDVLQCLLGGEAMERAMFGPDRVEVGTISRMLGG